MHRVMAAANKHFQNKECKLCFIDIRFSFPMVWTAAFSIKMKKELHTRNEILTNNCVRGSDYFRDKIPN
jgi:hypothetical protein